MKYTIAVLPFVLLLAACSGGNDRFVLDTPPSQPQASALPFSLTPPSAPEAPRSAGPLMLAGIGSYMDAQESDLRNRLRGTGALVLRPGDDLVVVLRNDLLLDGMQVSAGGSQLLASIAAVLRHYDRSAIQIQGFTDTTGAPDRNLALSDARARAVYNVLVQDGIARPRLSAQGFGETRLRVSTGDNVAEPRNRRIEFRIMARPG